MELALEIVKGVVLFSFILSIVLQLILSQSLSDVQKEAVKLSTPEFKGSLKTWQKVVFYTAAYSLTAFFLAGTVGLAMFVSRYIL